MGPRIVLCPSCGAQLDVSAFPPGTRFRCGSCSRELTAPAPVVAPSAPVPARRPAPVPDQRFAAPEPAPIPPPIPQRPRGPPPVRSRRVARGRIPNLLPWAIVATLLCCQLGGIIAIVYAVQANSRAQEGNIRAAEAAVKTAKTWLWISLATPFVILAVFFVAALMGAQPGR